MCRTTKKIEACTEYSTPKQGSLYPGTVIHTRIADRDIPLQKAQFIFRAKPNESKQSQTVIAKAGYPLSKRSKYITTKLY